MDPTLQIFGLGGVVVVLLLLANWWLKSQPPDPPVPRPWPIGEQTDVPAQAPDSADGLPPLLALDVETTGFDPARGHRVVQVAAIRLEHKADSDKVIFAEVGRLVTLLNPQRRMGATKIHGIRGADVKDAPLFGAVAANLARLMEGAMVVGHNVAFDVRFVAAEFERVGRPLPKVKGVICTLDLARKKLDLPDYKLPTCCEALGIQVTDWHSAEADALASLQVAEKLLM